MTVAAIFIKFANCSQPVASNLAVILDPGASVEEVESIIKGSIQDGSDKSRTIEATLDVIVKALEGKFSVCESKVIMVNTELFY